MICQVEEILKHFSAGPAEILRTAGGTASPKYVICASGAKYLLRKRRREFSPKKVVRFDQSVIFRLKQEDFPVAPPEKTTLGESAVFQGEEAWELFRYIEALENFREGNENQIRSAGETLGRMHSVLQNFKPEGEKNWTREFSPEKIKRELLGHAGRLPGVLRENIAKKVFGELENLIGRFNTEGIARTIIHGDYTSANIKFKGNAPGGIFDFDWTMLENAAYDIARGIVYFCAERDEPLDGDNIFSLVQPCRIIPARAALFIQAYRREFHLAEKDILMLPLSLKEFFIGSRVRAMRKVPDIEKPKLLDESLLGMLEAVESGGYLIS